MIRVIKMLLLVVCFCGIYGKMIVYAQEADYENSQVEVSGFSISSNICDQNIDTFSSCKEKGSVKISNSAGIRAVYIEFDRIPATWKLQDPMSGVELECGENAFLHEYVDVFEKFGNMPQELILSFDAGTAIADIYAFSDGEMPDWVQRWQPPCEKADLLLISSHSDDEQLFFAGVLPYYAGERKLKVQVAYVVQHFEANNVANHQRPHEQLNGLWTVGVRNYPIMSDFPDLYAVSKDRDVAFAQASKVFEAAGITYDDFVCYITECLRRFKPLVVVSHDLNGEYGHGTHVLCSAALTEAIECAADFNRYPESAERYGVCSAEKVYLHLYEENGIKMNFDTPLKSFNGKTAFEVSQEGFACHLSQHWTWFYKWIYGTEENPIRKAVDIKSYSPCLYGLYYTNVGEDVKGEDFFENVVTYAEREAQEKAEAERVAREKQKEEQQKERALIIKKAAETLRQSVVGENTTVDKSAKRMHITIVLAFVVLLMLSGMVIGYCKRKK